MFKLPNLPYAYDALEPYIDKQTMTLHHQLHHQGYVDKLNTALEGKEDLQSMEISELLKKLATLPQEVVTAVRNNGGGHANHSFFWTGMGPEKEQEPEGVLKQAIDTAFSGFTAFQEKFTQVAATLFGSGWVWLVVADGKLEITTTGNQDSPVSIGKQPLLCLDVWEHAYYLKYQNKRAEYIAAWWKVVNFRKVEELFGKL